MGSTPPRGDLLTLLLLDNDQSGPGTVKAELNNEVKEELSDQTMTNRAEVRIDVTAPLSGSVTPSTRRPLGKQAGVSPLRARYEKFRILVANVSLSLLN